MNAERWRRKTLPSLRTAPPLGSQNDLTKDTEIMDGKKPRAFSKALRSLSNSSVESMSRSPSRNSTRRLQKAQSGSGSMIDRIHRRVSRDSTVGGSPPDFPGFVSTDSDIPHALMEVVLSGPLKADISLLKAKSEYLVLTNQCLVKFSNPEAARVVFPQLPKPEGRFRGSGPSTKSAAADIRMEIPLRSVVAVFKEEGASPRFGIEVWWFSQWPRLAYSKTHFFFAHPKERDDWLADIQQTCRTKLRGSTITSTIPDNLKTRINHIVDTTETSSPEGTSPTLIFPVAKRTIPLPQKANSTEDSLNLVDSSSFYVVIGTCMCYLIEVLKADYMTSAGDLRLKVESFGTVTLTRFKASVASQEQRFVMTFRLPFGRETRLELASIHYRRIIDAMTKVDRELKPMWPQHFQQAIFDIKGLPPPLQLTSGNDLGGLERSLKAYCAAFRVQVPRWTIEWNKPSQPAFRLLPSDGPQYLQLQLLAVFRALRYNSFFKALSFRDVDLSALAGKKDYSHYGDAILYTSLTGLNIPEDHYDILLQAPVLTQEFHALVFASESIRNIDLTNVLGAQNLTKRQSQAKVDLEQCRQYFSEVLRPILILIKNQLCLCHGITVTGNPLSLGDVEDLANLLLLDRVCFKKLELANCHLGDAAISELWLNMAGQAGSLQTLDTSGNHGIVKFELIQHSLSQLRAITKLNIAGNTRIDSDMSLFDEDAIHSWALEDLDISGIGLNNATVDVLSDYLGSTSSQNLKVIRLNSCGLSGRQVAQLFRAMGQARQLTVHMSANRLDEGIDELCGAISCGFGPDGLFMQMIDFAIEDNYIKLLRALTVNKTIECLSLAGCSTPGSASDTACQALSEFFSNNNTIRFLDVSGYDAKLDEGRLGRGFSKALSGLRTNTRLEHLRVRSQMLNVNIGDLAEAITTNRTIHTLDCEGNDFNLSNFRHLVKHLQDNTTIRYFSAFSDRDLSKTIQKSVENAISATTPVRRASVIARFRHEKPQQTVGRPLVQQLKGGWDDAVQALQRVMERNQMIFQEGIDNQREASPHAAAKDKDNDVVFSKAFGGLALRSWESRRGRSRSSSTVPAQRSSTISLATSASRLQGLAIDPGTKIMRSYSLVSSCDSVLSPATASPSTGSAMPTPPELESPVDKEYSLGNQITSKIMRDENLDYDYTYQESQEGDYGPDFGLEMRAHQRRFWSDEAGCIEEEDKEFQFDSRT
ncbi:Fc.00g111980.m01.CDS01 [Cosmosporella sp. VM-42]